MGVFLNVVNFKYFLNYNFRTLHKDISIKFFSKDFQVLYDPVTFNRKTNKISENVVMKRKTNKNLQIFSLISISLIQPTLNIYFSWSKI